MEQLTFKDHRILLLKVLPNFYADVDQRNKNFEVRKNDRNYQLGDILVLAPFLPETGYVPGEFCVRQVKYILEGGQFGIEAGYCVLGIGIYFYDEHYKDWYNSLMVQETLSKS